MMLCSCWLDSNLRKHTLRAQCVKGWRRGRMAAEIISINTQMVWLDRQNAQREPERQRAGSLFNLRDVGVGAGDEGRAVSRGEEEEGR